MKTIGKFLVLVFAVTLFAVAKSEAQVYVKVPPAPPKNIRKATRPNKYMIWVPEDWAIVNNRYMYHEGYWAMPPTPKSVYIPGYWRKMPKGYARVPGYWKNPHL